MKNNLNLAVLGSLRRELVIASAVFIHLAALAAPGTPAGREHPANSLQKGASRLVQKAPAECLPSETNNPTLARLAAQWREQRAETVRYPTIRSNRVVRIAVHQFSRRPDRPILVFVHGLLSDHQTWKYVAADLVRDYEIWLIDLPGCGESDAPKPSALESDGYGVSAMGERVLQALQESLAKTSSTQSITLVGHSLGGTVVLRIMSSPSLRNRYPVVLHKVDRIVLLAPCDLAIHEVPAKFQALLGLKGWKIGLGECLGVLEPRVRSLTKANFHLPECATLEHQERYIRTLKDAGHREAGKAMLLQAVPFDHQSWRPKWKEIDTLTAEYHNIHVPSLIAYGDWDETLPAAMGNKLKDELAGSLLIRIPARGHSLPTEDPVLCSELIRGFQRGESTSQLAQGHLVRVYENSSLTRNGAPSVARETPL